MLFNLYVGNHGKKVGIEDYISIISDVFGKRGHEVIVSETLRPDAHNIVIDEFTNYIANLNLREFRRDNPKTKIIYVLTEFVERRKLVSSFNFFGGWLEASAIAAMSVYFRWLRKDYLPASLRDWTVAILYMPLLAIFYAAYFIRNSLSKRRTTFTSRLHAIAYLQMRYLGLEAHLQFADYAILSHPLIGEQLRLLPSYKDWHGKVIGTLYPELDINEIVRNLFRYKRLFIEVTGSVTPYRQKFIDQINRDILSLGLSNHIDRCQAISFSNHSEMPKRGAYSLHPPQSKKWCYCSPTRLYRALQVDHNVPIITKSFGQHPIEKLCLTYNSETFASMYSYYTNKDKYIIDFRKIFEEYNQLATANNDQIFKNL